MNKVIQKKLYMLLLFVVSLKGFTQSDNELQSKIDSFLQVNINNKSKEVLKEYHRNLKLSQEISYLRGELNTYGSLLWYHGYLSRKENSLDSVLYYTNVFERKISSKEAKINKDIIADFYIDKGTILNEIFQLTEEALNSFLKAYPWIEKDNLQSLVEYDLSVAKIYYDNKEYKLSIGILKNRLKDSLKIPKKIKVDILQRMANVYTYWKKPNESIKINKRLLNIVSESESPNTFWWIKNEIARNYFEMGEINKAKKFALLVREKFKDNKYTMGVDNNSDLLSQIFESIDINKSISYLESALSGNELFYKYSDFFAEQFTRLGRLYEMKKKYNKSSSSYKKSNEIYNNIHQKKEKLLLTYADLSKKYYDEKNLKDSMIAKNELLTEKNKRQKLFVLLLGGIFFILILSFILFYYYTEYKKGEVEVEKLKVNEKKLLEEQISIRDNELEATVINFSKRLSILSEIKKELKSIDNEEVKNIKNKISALIDSTLDVSVITEKISSKYPSLTILLKDKFPSLTNREIDYCLLTKLNLTIKETASILNVSPGTVKVTRNKLKNKMNSPAELSLKQFLDSITNLS